MPRYYCSPPPRRAPYPVPGRTGYQPVNNHRIQYKGNPIPSFTDLVLEVKPTQVTLVPTHDVITSNAGWDTLTFAKELKEWVAVFKKAGIRTSLFIDPVPEMIRAAAQTGADRVELYTESYAAGYEKTGNKPLNLMWLLPKLQPRADWD